MLSYNMKKVLIMTKVATKGMKFLENNGYRVVMVEFNNNQKNLIKELKREKYDALLSTLTNIINLNIFESAPNLEIVANLSPEYHNIDLLEAKKRNVIITNTPCVSTDSVAEYTIALVLSLGRHILSSDISARGNENIDQKSNFFVGKEFRGGKFTLLGAGAIASRVGEIAKKGLDMDIHYFDINRNKVLEKECNAIYHSNIEEAILDSDVISIHLPLLPNTEGIINDRLIKLMNERTLLINTSTSLVVDENALLKSLKSHSIGGAALDNLIGNENQEKFKELKNVIITPNISTNTKKARDNMSLLAAQNIDAVLSGGKPITEVV